VSANPRPSSVVAGAAAPPPPILRDTSPGLARTILHVVYDAAWIAAMLATSPFFAARSLASRPFARMVAERLALRLPRRGTRRRVLVHGVSVGEVKGAAPLVRALAESQRDLEIVVSATTATGLEVARQLYPGLAIVRFPIDVSPCVRRFLRRVDPAAVVLVELEVWPNFLRECNRAGIPVAVVNGRITRKSFGQYLWFRRALPQFNRISLFCVQLEEYAARFRDLGGAPERVIVTGNMKADGLARRDASALAPKVAELRARLGGRAGQLVVVGGSTHAPEELWLARARREGAPDARLVLVPRHPQRASEIARELASAGFGEPQLLTELRRGSERPDPARPALVDTIGELEAVYSLADIVFVGGSLIAHGGQNVLEPAAQGRPVMHGPYVDNFQQEAALLEARGASVCVKDVGELGRRLGELARDPERRARMAAAGADAVRAQEGATALTLQALVDRCLDPGGAAGAAQSARG
jgi:3-deoxy-D-manno-octulosonic-acid transferase